MWLIPSCLSVPASPVSSLESKQPSTTRVFWATSSATPSPRPSCWPGWKTRAWSRRLFTAETLKNATSLRSLVKSIASSPAFRVSRSQSPAQSAELRMKGLSSTTLPAPFARLDVSEFSWKTSQACLLPGLDTFSESWPKWGFMQHGEAFELPKWAPAIDASESSSWPTPRSSASENRTTQNAPSHGKTHGKTLAGEAASWPTPTAGDQKASGSRKNGTTLTDATKQWPTPSANDHKGSSQVGQRRGQLSEATEQIHTFSRQVQEMPHGSQSSKTTRRLNPRFAEWLMGWPIGWTDSEQSVTEFAAYRRRLRGLFLKIAFGVSADE